ncbi:hypothetical protein BH09BAC6_BH09BAC6_32460 [soil metagenome]|jgi:hypothetical protein
MRKTLLTICMLLSIAVCNSNAQVKTKYGDDVSTLDGIIKAYYDVVTVKKGEKVSYERDSLLHIANVRVGAAGVNEKGMAVFHYFTLKEFHKKTDPFIEKDGFIEKEVQRNVQHVGNIYNVWSTYVSKHTPDGPVIERGINSIELFYDGSRFWIIGWFYD